MINYLLVAPAAAEGVARMPLRDSRRDGIIPATTPTLYYCEFFGCV